jgi:hypothetical protein
MATSPSERDPSWTITEVETAYDALWGRYGQQRLQNNYIKELEQKVRDLQQRNDVLRDTGIFPSTAKDSTNTEDLDYYINHESGSEYEESDDAEDEDEDEEGGSCDNKSEDDHNTKQTETTIAVNDKDSDIAKITDRLARFDATLVSADSPSPSQPCSSKSDNPDAK